MGRINTSFVKLRVNLKLNYEDEELNSLTIETIGNVRKGGAICLEYLSRFVIKYKVGFNDS